jgi:L-galactose dehydrogenase
VIYRSLGRTGIKVSIIGFGASPLGDVFGTVSLQQGSASVRHAIEQGINLFDVAPYYGLTLAEDRLGVALAGCRHEIVLATKCGRYGEAQFDFSAATVTRELESSLRRLRTDYVDLLQIHDVEFGSVSQIIEETLPALRVLQQQGKARFIGITGYWPQLLARICRSAPVDTILNYCHCNLLMDDMNDELAPVAERSGAGLMNASPLHMGLLGSTSVPAWHPAPLPVKAAAQDVIALCQTYDISPATLALSYCLQRDSVASTLVGLGSIAEVDESLAALDFEPPPNLMRAIGACIKPVFNTVWPSGLPENQPNGMPHAC